jgi:hypothetical protein
VTGVGDHVLCLLLVQGGNGEAAFHFSKRHTAAGLVGGPANPQKTQGNTHYGAPGAPAIRRGDPKLPVWRIQTLVYRSPRATTMFASESACRTRGGVGPRQRAARHRAPEARSRGPAPGPAERQRRHRPHTRRGRPVRHSRPGRESVRPGGSRRHPRCRPVPGGTRRDPRARDAG